eukprot:9503981-Pyramimonas_sp.AAC.2
MQMNGVVMRRTMMLQLRRMHMTARRMLRMTMVMVSFRRLSIFLSFLAHLPHPSRPLIFSTQLVLHRSCILISSLLHSAAPSSSALFLIDLLCAKLSVPPCVSWCCVSRGGSS